MAISDFDVILSQKSKLVDQEIEKIIPKQSEIPNLNDAIWYMLSSGGKRLRPAIGLLCTEALNGDIGAALRFGVSVELVHNYLLIHDDIEDGDTVRRSLPAVWVKYGLPHAVNIGDYMCNKVYEAILSLRQLGLPESKILNLCIATVYCLNVTGEGQAMEINARSGTDLGIDEYMKITQLKTGAYLTLPIIGAAIISGAKKDVLESIGRYGDYVGPAFQIEDDILDLTGGKGRCEIGCDIKEGKRSYMTVYTAANCNSEEKSKLFALLNKPREQKTPEDVSWVINLFNRYNAIETGRNQAETLISQGKNELTDVPSSLRKVLIEFADYSARRSH